MFDFLKKDNRTEFEKKVDAKHKKRAKGEKAELNQAKKKVDYGADLRECDRLFSRVIDTQLAKIKELQENGIDVWENEKIEIQQASIGKLIVKRALIELHHSGSDNDLNKAKNMLGMALIYTQKLKTIDVDKVGFLQSKFIEYAIPSNQSKDIMKSELDGNYEISEEFANKVDDTFVESLINGESFEDCLNKNNYSTNRSSNRNNNNSQEANDSLQEINNLLNKPL